VPSAWDRYDRAKMRRLCSLTIIKGDANGGVGELRPQRGSSEVLIGTACATPEEFTAIGTEGVIFPTPFEVTRKAMTIHVHPTRRATFRLRHGYLPGSPAAISPRAATLRFPRCSLTLSVAAHQLEGRNLLREELPLGRSGGLARVAELVAAYGGTNPVYPGTTLVVCGVRSVHRHEVSNGMQSGPRSASKRGSDSLSMQIR
jgi:hypothetical protein